jgi:hypothetical protein
MEGNGRRMSPLSTERDVTVQSDHSSSRFRPRRQTRPGLLTRRTAIASLAGPLLTRGAGDDLWVTYEGRRGPGHGKRVVLISGDEEYRSEEALPQLGKILATHHGFYCTVLFAIDPKDGTINPDVRNHIPGMESLSNADLMIVATRFRELPDDQMRHFDEYVHSGRPIIGLRTATHAFNYPANSTSPYKHYSYQDKATWPGGFGKQVLGETWISHHGHHAVQSTRGLVAPDQRNHPIVHGCNDIWGPTDVYTVNLPLPSSATVLVLGQVLEGMNTTDKPVAGDYVTARKDGQKLVKRPNDPMMPVAWTNSFTGRSGKTSRVFTTTMGAASDFSSEGLRRLVVNAVFWSLGMNVPKLTKVDLVGEFRPTFFGFGKYVRSRKPADYT